MIFQMAKNTQNKRMQRLLTALILISMGTVSGAFACGFHNYAPQPTMVDRLIGSDHIVLARQNPANPFRYEVTKALEGNTDGVELPQLVDTVSRRRFAIEPDAQALFVRDGPYGPWLRVAFIDQSMRPVLDAVLANLNDWELGDEESRYRTFASFTDHPDPNVRTLALRELDRADYGFLLSEPLAIDAGRILSRFNNPTQRDLRAIRVLLLGLSGNPTAIEPLNRGFESAARFESSLTGAYATALIELEGADKATALARNYLVASDLPEASVEAIIEALALHSQYGDDAMKQTVAVAVSEAVQRNPRIAPAIARQFGARGVWSQQATMSELVQEGGLASPLDILAVSQYIAMASGETDGLSSIAPANKVQKGFD